MKRLVLHVAAAFQILLCAISVPAHAQDNGRYRLVDANGNLQALIAKHAAGYGVPESLVRRVIHRESRGNPRAISNGNYGLMQIRLGTARAMGYRGDVQGLLDADINMTYAVKYLAGAYKVAGGNHDLAVRYYAAGYYDAAERKEKSADAGVTVSRSRQDDAARAAGVAMVEQDRAKGNY